MVQTTIQIRRITDKVGRYFQRFGYRSYTKYFDRGALINGNKILGPDRFQCRVAETSRGTAVSFYTINLWTNFLPFLPFILMLILSGLNKIDAISKFISGENSFLGVKWISLFLGNFNLNILSVLLFIVIPGFFSFALYSIQNIRLSNLKNRFAFFTKDAIWEPRDIPLPLIMIKAAQTAFTHVWFLAILFFSVFALPDNIMGDVTAIYGIKEGALASSLQFGFAIIAGLIGGLIAGQKSLLTRRELSRYDSRLRISGGYYERKIDPILYGIQSALVSGLFIIPFLAMTFITTGNFGFAGFTIAGLAVGGAISGTIFEEGPVWFAGSYIAILFFTSIALVFRTGQEPALAFVVILILFFAIIPFFILSSVVFDLVLQKYKIRTVDHYYDYFPLNPLWTLIQTQRRIQETIRTYEESLAEEHVITESGILLIDKTQLLKKGKLAERIAKHYFELLAKYNSMFDEEDLVMVPTSIELVEWWSSKTGIRNYSKQLDFLNFTDRLIWDPEFKPEPNDLKKHDEIGFNMIVSLES